MDQWDQIVLDGRPTLLMAFLMLLLYIVITLLVVDNLTFIFAAAPPQIHRAAASHVSFKLVSRCPNQAQII